MDAALLSALAALAGSVVGGLTSGFTNWLSHRAQTKASLLAHALSRPEELFKDFMIAASKSYGEALMSNTAQLQELVELYGMISRMRAVCWPHTVACAEKVLAETIAAYSVPNRSVPQIHELLKSGTGIDPLKDFAEAARAELQSIDVSLRESGDLRERRIADYRTRLRSHSGIEMMNTSALWIQQMEPKPIRSFARGLAVLSGTQPTRKRHRPYLGARLGRTATNRVPSLADLDGRRLHRSQHRR